MSNDEWRTTTIDYLEADAVGWSRSMRWLLNIFTTIKLLLLSVRATAFQFPKIKFVGIPTVENSNTPQKVVQKSPKDAAELRKKLEIYCGISVGTDVDQSNRSFRWEPHLRQSYEVAAVIFEEIAQVTRQCQVDTNQHKLPINQLILSFPSMAKPEHLELISTVLQSDKCKQLLGLEDAQAEFFPSSPAPYLCIKFSSFVTSKEEPTVTSIYVPADTAASATKEWVNNFLGRYRLCPYTTSVSRAAVGLSSVGVPVGGVHVRAEYTRPGCTHNAIYSVSKASELVANFWSEVVILMNSTQEEWATSLLVFPEYDLLFEEFIDVCDSIIEPTVIATQSTAFIGRAWFHPLYDADTIGHSDIIAGHAVPHKMVEGFMKSLSTSSSNSSGVIDGKDVLEYDELVRTNNKVRHTPHATINILRRNQLLAAAEYEKGLGKKKPQSKFGICSQCSSSFKGVT